jgi:hypothetical protein
MLVADLGTVALRGEIVTVLAWGERLDNVWEGWLTFFASDGTVYRTGRETVQPNVDALVYWAGGLRPVYLDGAMSRAEPVAPADAGLAPAENIAAGAAGDPSARAATTDDDHGDPSLPEGTRIVEVVAVDAASGRCTVRAGDRHIVLEPTYGLVFGVHQGDRISLRLPPAA